MFFPSKCLSVTAKTRNVIKKRKLSGKTVPRISRLAVKSLAVVTLGVSSSPPPGAALPQLPRSWRMLCLPRGGAVTDPTHSPWGIWNLLFLQHAVVKVHLPVLQCDFGHAHIIILNTQPCEIKCQLLDESHHFPLQCLLKEKNKSHHNCCVSVFLKSQVVEQRKLWKEHFLLPELLAFLPLCDSFYSLREGEKQGRGCHLSLNAPAVSQYRSAICLECLQNKKLSQGENLFPSLWGTGANQVLVVTAL